MKATKANHIVLFDGVCNLCNSSVRFIYQRDKQQQFSYQSLQSDEAKELLKPHGYDPSSLQSILLLSEGQLFEKSSAVIKIGQLLGKPYSFGQVFSLIPQSLRDAIYDFVARNRYRWFGKKDYCVFDPNFQQKVYGTSTD